MHLLDAVYLYSPGGIVLLKAHLNRLTNSQKRITILLLDYRMLNVIDNQFEYFKVIFCYRSEFFRLFYYYKFNNIVRSVFCFSNIPPVPCILKLSKVNVYIMFHNVLICEKVNFKSFYIKLLNSSNYVWIVQNEYVRELLKSHLGIFNIKILPFFLELEYSHSNFENAYFYPSTGLPHKNHNLLFSSWKSLVQEKNFQLPLFVTLEHNYFKSILSSTDAYDCNIFNLGIISHNEVISKMRKVKYLIFPSLNESFGLPLIESTFCGNCILVSDLKVTKQLLNNVYFFNANSRDDIVNKVILSHEVFLKPQLKVINRNINLIDLIYGVK